MNPEDEIRRLRAADRWVPMAPRFLAPSPDSGAERGRPSGRSNAGRVRVALVTVVVLALVVVGAASVIRLVGPAAPALVTTPSASPTPTPTPTPTPGTVSALPRVAGRVLATWTEQSALPASEVVDAHGKAIAVTFACTGGGSVHYSLSGISDGAYGCDGITSGGPELSSKNGMLIAEHRVTVHVSVKGHPRFAFRVIAVPVTAAPKGPSAPTIAPSGPAVPASLRTCGTADLAPTASYVRWPHFQGGLLTVTSNASTDCAIRTWPTLRYLDSDGATIGGPAARDGDGPSAPIRLAAHGTAYVEIELFTLAALRTCGARQVTSLLLGIGHATVRVPIPAEPAVGKCVDPNVVADGVGAATAYKPTGP